MSKTMNMPNWLRVGIGVAICTGLYLGGIYIGDWRATTRARSELSAVRDEAIALAEENARLADAQSRLDAIERALAEARTIHVERGADGVLSASVIRTDKSGYEVQGRTLDALIGGGNG